MERCRPRECRRLVRRAGARSRPCGRSSFVAGADCRTSTSDRCTPPTQGSRCTTLVMSIPGVRKACLSGWSPRRPLRRRAQTRRTRSSILRAISPTGTHVLRHPGRSAAPVKAVATYALRLGDDALILSHRLAEWAARAPGFEEDIALTNIGLDLLGQARMLLTYAGEVEGAGRDEDDLAYLRDERDQRAAGRVGVDDFALTIARQLLFSSYQWVLYEELRSRPTTRSQPSQRRP